MGSRTIALGHRFHRVHHHVFVDFYFFPAPVFVDYQRVLAQHGIVCSMSRGGDCWDNAVAESFFATLKVELVHDATWATRTAARTELFDYLEV